ncbi:MAG: PIN domain-containing protein [Sandaracinaceae bacterium]|nr:PIN domain-containing protein [Sandaracinaceae bacterium]
MIDANAIIYVIGEDAPDPVRRSLQENTRRSIEWVQQKGAVIVVPAPVLAELAHVDTSSRQVLDSFLKHLSSSTRIEPFDEAAAVVAGDLLRILHPERQPGENRHQMKYDVMVFSIAQAIGAAYLVTGERNPRGFPRYIQRAASSMELIVGPDLPKGYQTELAGT